MLLFHLGEGHFLGKPKGRHPSWEFSYLRQAHFLVAPQGCPMSGTWNPGSVAPLKLEACDRNGGSMTQARTWRCVVSSVVFVISGGFSSSGSAGGGLRLRVLSDLPPALPSHRWLLAPGYHLLAISLGWQRPRPSPLRPPPQVGTLQNDTALSQRDVCGWSQFLGCPCGFPIDQPATRLPSSKSTRLILTLCPGTGQI